MILLQGQDCAESAAPLTPDLVSVEPLLGLPKIRNFMRLDFLSTGISIIPFNHSISTLKRAVAERVFFVKENGVFVRPPIPVNFSRKLSNVFESLKPLLPRTVPWSYQDFLGSTPSRKRKVYESAVDDLLITGPVCGKDAEVSVFIKYEKTDCTNKLDPIPRVISPRSPRFNVCLGRYLKKIEPKIFKSIRDVFGEVTVIKGYNPYKSASILRSKWDLYSDPVAIGLDASRFDQHVSVDALKFEHSVYLQCFPLKRHRKKLKKLLAMQLKNRCVGYCPDGKLKYTIEGTRMSGDMNTSLGNCVLMCCMIKAYLEQVGVKASLANNGDDCVVFMERTDMGAFTDGLFDWFYGMGFNMKIEEPVDIFEKVNFCQTNPVFDGKRWIMTRNPLAILTKDSVFLQPYQSARQVTNWMGAVGLGGLRTCGALPVVQEYYNMLARYGTKSDTKSEEFMSWYMRSAISKMDRDYGPVSAVARASYYQAFDITPDEQMSLESFYANCRVAVPTKTNRPVGRDEHHAGCSPFLNA